MGKIKIGVWGPKAGFLNVSLKHIWRYINAQTWRHTIGRIWCHMNAYIWSHMTARIRCHINAHIQNHGKTNQNHITANQHDIKPYQHKPKNHPIHRKKRDIGFSGSN